MQGEVAAVGVRGATSVPGGNGGTDVRGEGGTEAMGEGWLLGDCGSNARAIVA